MKKAAILISYILFAVALTTTMAILSPVSAQDDRSAPYPYYVLDGLGGIHSGNSAPLLYGLPYWGDDVFEEIEIVEVRCDPEYPDLVWYVRAIVLDSLGGVWEVSSRGQGFVLWTAIVPYKPYMMATSLADGDETPFFGFDVARDVEVLVNPYRVWEGCK